MSSGYYTAGNEGDLLNLTRTRQVLCTAGSFCIIGVRHLCPAGTYGNRAGETGTRLLDVPHLSTLRSARRTDGAPGTASTIIEPADNTPHEHYNDDEQSHYAKQRGHGSVRTTEGGFNRDGIVHHAASSFCSGWCPAVRCCSARARERQNTEEAFPFARPSSHFLPPFSSPIHSQGHYCPPGTVAPIACKQGTYSTQGASACSDCPSARHSIAGAVVANPSLSIAGAPVHPKCTHSKHCCSL